MEKIKKFVLFNRLKSVYRLNSVSKRKESSAEHSWSCLILADFFLSLYNFKVDRLKVYELLMYHDVIEVEILDQPIFPNQKLEEKNIRINKENEAMKTLQSKLPFPLNEKFFRLFNEFKEQKSLESRFAKAIDVLDPIIHELDYKEDWKGWSKEFLLEKKLEFLEEFPPLKEIFFELISYLEKNHYF